MSVVEKKEGRYVSSEKAYDAIIDVRRIFSGNFPRRPFEKGAPCTRCPSGHGWCVNGLCRRGESSPLDCLRITDLQLILLRYAYVCLLMV